MDKDSNIERLICLFMEGQTSLDEEQQLAEYFRTHAVPQEWEAYKEMFAYFDEGMPAGRYEAGNGHAAAKRRVAWAVFAAAAAIALLLVMTWNGRGGNQTRQERQPQTASLTPDTTSASPSDTTLEKTAKPMTTTKKRRADKYKYRIAPPKTYYAAAEKSAAASVEDSILDNERLIAAQLRSAELTDELLLRKLKLIETAHNMEIALATDGTDDEDGGTEDVY